MVWVRFQVLQIDVLAHQFSVSRASSETVVSGSAMSRSFYLSLTHPLAFMMYPSSSNMQYQLIIKSYLEPFWTP
jgi:hypothetical protein